MNSLLALVIIFATAVSTRADDFSQEKVKSTALASSIYMLEGAGGNMTALVGKDGTLLVDDDFAEMASKVTDSLKKIGGAPPRLIVNTHFHYDHTGGNEVLGPAAIIIAATAVRTRLMTEQTLWHKQHAAEPPQAWPLITFDQSLTLHLNGDDVRVVHLPNGHTDGDSVVFFAAGRVVAMGDLYFSGMYPIFHPEHDGSLIGYLRDIDAVLAQIGDDWKVVPGHGPLSSRAELAKYREMILDCIATVRHGMKSGLTLAQIQKIGLNKKWGAL